MPELNRIIHEPVRLRIMAAINALDPNSKVEFTYLRKLLAVSDGNLGAHLQKLEEAGFIEIEKAFEERKPHTYVKMTTGGRRAFTEHVEALQELLQGGTKPRPA